MNKFFLNIGLFVLTILTLSCSNNEYEIGLDDFSGVYKIQSINSSLTIDINNDGIKSNDYLQEIKSNYISYNGELINYGYNNELKHNFAEARPTKFQSNSTKFLDIKFPIQRIDSIYQGNNNFVTMTMEYVKMNTAFIYELTNKNIKIASDPLNHFEYYNINNFAVNRLNKDEFEIQFNFKIYDFSEKDWIETNLKTRYLKVED